MFFPMFFSALFLFHPTLFYSSFYFLFCFLPLFIHFIFWSPLLFSFQICYPFFSFFLVLCSVCFFIPWKFHIFNPAVCFFSAIAQYHNKSQRLFFQHTSSLANFWGSPKIFWGSPMSYIKICPQGDMWGAQLPPTPSQFLHLSSWWDKEGQGWRVEVKIKVIQLPDFWSLSQILDRNLSNFLVV